MPAPLRPSDVLGIAFSPAGSVTWSSIPQPLSDAQRQTAAAAGLQDAAALGMRLPTGQAPRPTPPEDIVRCAALVRGPPALYRLLNRTPALLTMCALATGWQPEPTPTPTPPPPAGILVQPSDDWTKYIKSGATVLLPRGATFQQGYAPTSALHDVTIGTYGDPQLAPPRIAVNKGIPFSVTGWRNLTIDGIDFRGNGLNKVIRLFLVDTVLLRGVGVTNGSFGVVIEAPEGGKRNRNVRLVGCRVFDNDAPGGVDSTGIFANSTDGLAIVNCVVDHNGMSAGSGATQRNHGAYLHGSNGPAVVTENVFSRNSSHGLQARSGGTVKDNLFLDNPIHLSYGLVNGGGPVYPGGVSGEVSGNVFLGAGDIGVNAERGICLQLGNIRSAKVIDNVMCSDTSTGQIYPSITVETCHLNPGHHGGNEVGIVDLTIQQNEVDRKGAPLKVTADKVKRLDAQKTWGGPLKDVRAKVDWQATLPKLRDGRMAASECVAMCKAMA